MPPPPKDLCIACRGKGKSTSGYTCPICKGKGRKPPKDKKHEGRIRH